MPGVQLVPPAGTRQVVSASGPGAASERHTACSVPAASVTAAGGPSPVPIETIGSAPAGAAATSRATSVAHRTVMRIGAAYPGAIRHAGRMLVHTCVRVRDIDASVRFYELLGFERRGKLDFGVAFNIYMGLPGRRRHASS